MSVHDLQHFIRNWQFCEIYNTSKVVLYFKLRKKKYKVNDFDLTYLPFTLVLCYQKLLVLFS